MLQGEHVGDHEILVNRLWGGASTFGGALELIGSGALFLTPELTMLTKAGGVALGAHGTDALRGGRAAGLDGRSAEDAHSAGGRGHCPGDWEQLLNRPSARASSSTWRCRFWSRPWRRRCASPRFGPDGSCLPTRKRSAAICLRPRICSRRGFHPAVIDWNPSDLREVIDVLGRNRILRDFFEPKPTKINATGANFGIMSSFDGSIAVEMETKYRMTNFGTAFLRACHASKR